MPIFKGSYYRAAFWLLAFAPMVLIVLFTSQYLQIQEARYEQERRITVLHQLSTLRAHIENAINSNLLPFRGLMAHISLHGGISNDSFKTVAEALLSYQTDVRHIALLEGTTIRMVHPSASNDQALGANLLAIPTQSATVARVMNTLQPVLAGPVELVQGGTALIGRLPISASPTITPGQTNGYWGQASVVIDFDRFLASAGLTTNTPLRLALRGVDGRGAEGPVFFGDPALFDDSALLLEISLPSGNWLLAGMPREGWTADFPFFWPIRLVKWLLLAAWMLLILSIMHYFRRHRKNTEQLRAMNDELENRVRERSNALADKQAQLAHAGRLASLGEMATAIAHEIGQPLQIIKTSTGIIREDLRNNQMDPERVNMLVEKIVNNVDRAATIIQHVRNFARQDDRPPEDRVLIQRYAKEAISLYNAQFREHEIFLDTSIEEHLPPILVQPHKIQQIIVNLLSNARHAVEARAQNDPTLHKAIHLRLFADAIRHAIILEVADNGTGMTPEVKRRCMDPFYTTKPMNEGTGLGLSITYGIVKEYNGAVEIESEPGNGTTFRIIIPLKQPSIL